MLKKWIICLAMVAGLGVTASAVADAWPATLKPLPDWAWAQIREDLAPFADGIDRSQLDGYCYEEDGKTIIPHEAFKNRKFGVMRVVIQDNQVRAINPDRFAYWAKCYVDAVKKLAQRVKLPDMEYIHILESGVGPRVEGPVIGHSKSEGIRAILQPDFEMLTAYGLWGGYDKVFAAEPAWETKQQKLIWRGATTGGRFRPDTWHTFPRSKLVLFSLDHPDLVDARFTGIAHADPGVAEILKERGMMAGRMGMAEQLRYRYQIDVDGNSCTNSHFYWVLRSNSTALKVDSNKFQWYHRALEPWVHYVPVADDYSDLAESIEWLRADDAAAREIAQAGTQFALTYLDPETALSYLYAVLTEYAKLLKPAS
jgi:hypothetical protein